MGPASVRTVRCPRPCRPGPAPYRAGAPPTEEPPRAPVPASRRRHPSTAPTRSRSRPSTGGDGARPAPRIGRGVRGAHRPGRLRPRLPGRRGLPAAPAGPGRPAARAPLLRGRRAPGHGRGRLLALGAAVPGHQPHDPDHARVLTDPAGHPFCIVRKKREKGKG
ncbi:hypothetical protein STTU_3605 [Streptomyces sp. Tu6071]|nr:hypothetical protein STTU_3605 [Streptomyces sp. Tu6071]